MTLTDNPAEDPRRFFERPEANFTMMPNEFFDVLLPEVKSLGELKVMLVVLRATLGYQEEERLLPIKALMERTGMARQSVIDGAARAVEQGYFGRRRDGEGFVYGARIAPASPGTAASESPEPRPEKVQNLDRPPNKRKKTEKETLPVGENVNEKILAFWLALDPAKKPAEYKLTKKRKKAIDGRLADSSKQEIREALEGQWHDPWCQETGKLDLEYALRDRDHLEDFRDRRRKQVARSNGASSNGNGQAPSAHPEYDTTARNITVEAIQLLEQRGPLQAGPVARALSIDTPEAITLLEQMVEDRDCIRLDAIPGLEGAGTGTGYGVTDAGGI